MAPARHHMGWLAILCVQVCVLGGVEGVCVGVYGGCQPNANARRLKTGSLSLALSLPFGEVYFLVFCCWQFFSSSPERPSHRDAPVLHFGIQTLLF